MLIKWMLIYFIKIKYLIYGIHMRGHQKIKFQYPI